MVPKSRFVSLSTKLIRIIPLNRQENKVFMDISLSENHKGTQIKPRSVLGILWLQTHFESEHWESLRNGLVIIPIKDAQMLRKDAKDAGLNVNFINSLSPLDKK